MWARRAKMATSITFTGGGAVSIGGEVRTDDALLDLGEASQDAGLTYRDTSGSTHFVGVKAAPAAEGVTVSGNDVSGGTPGGADFARVDADELVVSGTIVTENLIVDGEIADPSGNPVMTLSGGAASFAAIADSAGSTGAEGQVLTLDSPIISSGAALAPSTRVERHRPHQRHEHRHDRDRVCRHTLLSNTYMQPTSRRRHRPAL